MKGVAAGIGVLCLSPLLLTGAALMAASAGEAAQEGGQFTGCADTIDTGKITELLDGANSDTVQIPGLDLPAEQVPNAQKIVATGIGLKVPKHGQIVALATAIQESRLRNLASGDRDSLGLFQQRPSKGWGTAQQIRDPVHASEKFYQRLLKVKGWEQLTVTQAAQAVQQSGHPDAYAQWEDLATALQKAIADTFPNTDKNGTGETDVSRCEPGEDGSGYGRIPEGSVPKGYTIPRDARAEAREAIRWAMGRLGTLYQWGGTCTYAHGPDPMGRCDCSSLMQQAYKHAGVTLTRTTYTQVNEGKAVPAKALEPGDLIFSRGTASRPEHVGLYMGEGLVIEAPRTGKPVRITPLKNWTILAVRRVL
ncbi:C40 family peptidase [Streptomyces sp. NPDC058653]|uniref:C40 family peptidase n=1 Tax=Streptomyces sp. NPDC058653 TaxID=3346576 RepID=UPI003649838F